MNHLFLAARVRIALAWVVVALTAWPCRAQGQATTAPASQSQSQQASGGYCGVYCLYAILQMNGRQTPFIDFLKPEYIGNNRGSTLAELQKAAQDHGLQTQPMGNLTSRELRSSPYPIILHVKSTPETKRYDHYVLCVGADDKTALVYDPPKPIERVSYAELATLWDGVGLVVSTEPIRAQAIFWPTWRMMMGFMMLALAAGVWWHRHAKKAMRHEADRRSSARQRLSLAMVQCCQLGAVALLVGVVYHLLASEGLLASPSAVANIVRAHEIGFLDKLDVKGVQQAIERNAVVIDARLPADYKAGHLTGAISIPVSTKSEERSKAITHVAKTSRIVIYCQSDKCPYAGKVASSLLREGYSNIALFPGGWMDWVNKQPKLPRQPGL